MRNRGFTLLEVMIAAALLSVVTAGAMAAFIAQSRVTNTQTQTISANDSAREAIRLISNDIRSSAAGITNGAGGMAGCDPGTVPFDGSGAGTAAIACLPPVFRTNTPLIQPLPPVNGSLGATTAFASSCGDKLHPGYQLTFSTGVGQINVPQGSPFCPDDLVVLGVDDTNPLFMAQSSPNVSSVGNAVSITFAGTGPIARTTPAGGPSAAGAGYGFDDSSPLNFLPATGAAVGGCGIAPASFCQPMMLFGGPNGAVLMNTAYGPGAVAGASFLGGGNPNCLPGLPTPCDAVPYPLVPSTSVTDLFRNNLAFGSVAVPAHLYRYSIEPVDVNGNPSPTGCTGATPCVSANLIRSLIVPVTAAPASTAPGDPRLDFISLSSTTLIQGVVDMQVEFGIQSSTVGQGLIYVNSGGLQASAWTPGTPGVPGAAANANADNCSSAQTDPGVWAGVCFPTAGLNTPAAGAGQTGMNLLASLRSVRLNLTIRSGTKIDTRSGTAMTTAAAVGAIPMLQPSVQDIGPNGNREAASWVPAFTAGVPYAGVPAMDGATYRQVSTEVYIRNIGWTNNL